MDKFNYLEELQKLFKDIQAKHFKEGYLLKGDVASVQSFIFNVQTKNAAKTLKAKSFYIQALTVLCVQFILDKYKLNTKEHLVYNGGAVFYILIPKQTDENWFKNLQQDIAKELVGNEPYLSIAYVEVNQQDLTKDISQKWADLNHQVSIHELQAFQGVFDAFVPKPSKKDINSKWKKFTEDFVKPYKNPTKELYKGFDLGTNKAEFIKFGLGLEFSYQDKSFLDVFETVLNKLPIWDEGLLKVYNDVVQKIEEKQKNNPNKDDILPKDGNIIDFECMSLFAEKRTGTTKLAVLKMDIDNLGTYFCKQQDLQTAEKLSKAFNWFFQNRVYDFLGQNLLNSNKEKYQENIYIIFSGGDDCFLIGAWDAVFEIAKVIHEEFQKFQETLRKNLLEELKKSELATQKEEEKETLYTILKNKEITLSAALLMIDEHFPVVRFAELAEEALDNAKKFDNGIQPKNAISVFGEVISWSDFEKVYELKNTLKNLVEIEGKRSVLERIKLSSVGFESLQEKAKKGFIRANQVWRFQYFLTRNIHTEQGKAIAEEKLVRQYQEYLINAISKNQHTDISIFPIAARWAEFLTRIDLQKTINEQ